MMMVKLHIDTFLYRYEAAEIRKLVISVETFDPKIFGLLSELYKDMNVDKEAIEITSHLDSGLYYIFNQPSELWNNSVALYDYSTDGLNYYRIDISKNKDPKKLRLFMRTIPIRCPFQNTEMIPIRWMWTFRR